MDAGIKLRFADKIMREEWRDFEKRHRSAIKRRTERRTGNLEDNRKYAVTKSTSAVTATLKHPVYERFLDMRKNYFGDEKAGLGFRRDVLTRRQGRKIHNRIIFGKLNPLSFRLLNELSDEVRNYMKKRFSPTRNSK